MTQQSAPVRPTAARHRRKTILIVAVSVFIVLALAVAAVPLALNFFGGRGVKTEGINEADVRPASTDIDGEWTVNPRPGPNSSSAGFTFNEVLPGERRTTSGSTRNVTGHVSIDAGMLMVGEIRVDMTTLTSDSDVRDSNVRKKLLHADQYPESTFTLTQPVSVSHVPDDGSSATVELNGDLTIHGETQTISHPFTVVRSGSRLVVAGDVPINRLDYGVESPEFVAASIADEGEINIRVNLTKK